MKLNPKVKAGAYGSGAALPLSLIIGWAANAAGLEMDWQVATAFGCILTGLASFVGGYLKPA